MSIAVVRDGRVVLLKGYGVRSLEKPKPVDARTLFAIASATKSFTAAALEILVDENKIDLDAPLRRYLPDLQLYDPQATETMTVRDVLAQKTCIEEKHLLTWNSPYDRADVMKRLRYAPAVCQLRSQFTYNDQMYLLAGQVIPGAVGIEWQDFVRNKVLVPLGMRDTTTSAAAALQVNNHATPYIELGGKFRPLPLFDEDNEAPAGAIHSSAADLARWLMVQLNDGAIDGTRVWSKRAAHEMHTPQMVVSNDFPYSALWPSAQFLSYGLGWFVTDFDGHKVLVHPGQSDGMHSWVSIMPDAKTGIAILTNSSLIGLPGALANRWYDEVLKREAHDWSKDFLKTAASLNDLVDPAAIASSTAHVQGTSPSLAQPGYQGIYHSDLLGEAVVESSEGAGLTLRLLGRSGVMTHWHYDVFRVDWGSDLELSWDVPFVKFGIDFDGAVDSMTLKSGDKFNRIQRRPR
jgi:CubicO group peptidase (beta-lactamase class C family)